MWRSRQKSPARTHNTFSNFRCSSFKDVQTLFSDDSDHHHNHNHQTTAAAAKPSIFHRVRLANTVLRALNASKPNNALPKPSNSHLPFPNEHDQCEPPPISLPGTETRVVVYLTSLRVVRSTFEDCRTVQSILRGFRVSIDERDLSMDSSFLDEIQRILGQPEKSKLTLPRVFIGGRYIGGADEVRRLHEAGELKKFFEGLPAAGIGVCEVCGGYRFILCDECSGSHKYYSEKGGAFRSCTACNENGLIRCPSCSCAPL